MQLDVNTSALESYSKKLKNLSRSAFPIAVRETLTVTAKDMKTRTLLDTSKKSFVNRTSTFFRANSRFEKATGFNVNSMESKTAFYDNSLKGSPKDGNYAIKDLEEQEIGGTIKKKSFIPMLGARSGGAKTLVRGNARLQKIKKAVIVSKLGFSNPKYGFVAAAHIAGKGGYVISKKVLWRVDSLNTVRRGLKLTPLYSFKKDRTVKVKPHKFVEKAGMMAMNKIDDNFKKQAQKQFEKALR